MDRRNVNDSARKDAYAMLDDTAQAALAERAKRAGLVTGRTYEAWEMLAPGRFRLRFAPAEHSGMHATVTGDRAVVQVVSEDGKERASVPMTKEGGRWRVKLPLSRARDIEPAVPAAVVPNVGPPAPIGPAPAQPNAL